MRAYKSTYLYVFVFEVCSKRVRTSVINNILPFLTKINNIALVVRPSEHSQQFELNLRPGLLMNYVL